MSTKKIEDVIVMIVDDDEDILAMVRYVLSSLHIHSVVTKRDGQGAVDFIKKQGLVPDLIICDWNMPPPNGVELLRMVKSKKMASKFLMLTGRKQQSDILDAKKSGVDAYMGKPFTVDDLQKKVRALLTKKFAPGEAPSAG